MNVLPSPYRKKRANRWFDIVDAALADGQIHEGTEVPLKQARLEVKRMRRVAKELLHARVESRIVPHGAGFRWLVKVSPMKEQGQ